MPKRTVLQNFEFEEKKIQAMAEEADDKYKKLLHKILNHKDKWRELVLTMLSEKELSVCTICHVVSSEKEASSVLLEGRREFFHGHEDSLYTIKRFSEIHHLCLKCYEKVQKEDGIIGKCDGVLKGQSNLRAFPAKKDTKGHLILVDGYWQYTNGTETEIKIPDEKLISLSQEYDIPSFKFPFMLSYIKTIINN